jgi:ribonuclease HI
MAFVTTAHVDGACDQMNTKAGGWAVVINHGEKVISGGSRNTTNNLMELVAIRAAITATQGSLNVRSDSEWAVKAITGEYEIKKNLEVVEEIRELMEGRNVELTWIARNSEPSHERADQLAKSQKERVIAELDQPEPEEPKGVDGDGE